MTTPLTPKEYEEYKSIIDNVLSTADLETISRKKIRQSLEAALGGLDLTEQKIAISNLIVSRFDAISTTPPTTKRSASRTPSPTRNTKKPKRSSSAEDADARLAAELQAQENSLARGRATRGGDKAPKKKKAPRKKSATKVKAEDDSDVSEGSKPKRKASGGGFQKPFILSAALSELTGEIQLSRPGVVKALWAHIKSNDLQDPSDRRQIICDDKMQAVFKQPKVDMFRMNKEISNHLYPVEDTA